MFKAKEPRSPSRFPIRTLPRNVWVVTLTSFLNDVASEMLATLLPLYLNNALGARTAAIGLIEGLSETTSSLLKVVSGRMSDRSGRRKPLAVAGYALSTASKPFLLVARSWIGVLGVRFTDRVGKGIRTPARDALLADSTPTGRHGLAFGIHRAGDTAGAVVGLLIGLAIVWLAQGWAPRMEVSTFRILILVSLIPASLAVLTIAVSAEEVPPSPATPHDPTVDSARLPRPFLRFLVIILVFTLGNSSDAFLVLRAQKAGLSVVGVLGIMIMFNVVYACVSGPAGAISDRLGRRKVLIAGWLVYALIYLGFARVDSPRQAAVLMTLYGFYYGATEGVAKAYVADLVPRRLRGTAFGIYNAAVGLAALPASLVAGLLWQGFGAWPGLGPAAPFYFGAILAALATVLLITSPHADAHEPATLDAA